MSSDTRPTPALDQPELVREKLEHWLAEQLGVELKISELNVPEGNGMSNITMLFDANIQEGGKQVTKPYVARIQPRGEALLFPDYNLGLQCQISLLIKNNSDIPVPTIAAKELSGDILGQPFYIMERVPGMIPPDIPPYHMDGWITEQSPEVRKKIWFAGIESMAGVHKIDVSSPAILQIIDQYHCSKNLSEQLDYWENYYQWGFQSGSSFLTHEIIEEVLPWLRENKPDEQVNRLCWGDSRMANVIFNNDLDDVAVLLDWEMFALGDPLQDLAWWVYMDELFSLGLDFPPLKGFPSREASVKFWENASGLSAENLNYYLVFAGVRFALIMGRMSIGMDNQDSINSKFSSCFEVKYLKKIFDAVKSGEK
ncbi:MAG: phosphotransferase family protein [Sinobacterium sp.]|nr:phosphotransferase family protein [Sinobacterium sp.]